MWRFLFPKIQIKIFLVFIQFFYTFPMVLLKPKLHNFGILSGVMHDYYLGNYLYMITVCRDG